MEKEKRINLAKKWLSTYESSLKPILKEEYIYRPIFIAKLCCDIGNLSAIANALDENAQEENILRDKLLNSFAEIIDLLNSSENDFDAFERDMDSVIKFINEKSCDEKEDEQTIVADMTLN